VDQATSMLPTASRRLNSRTCAPYRQHDLRQAV